MTSVRCERVAGLVVLWLLAAAPTGCGNKGTKAPLDPAEIQNRLAKGGSNWSSVVKSEGFPGTELTEGTRFWIWPQTDDLITIKRGNPTLTLAWSVRPGQPPLGADDLDTARLDFYVRTAGQFHAFGGQMQGWHRGDTDGTLQITPGPKIADLGGEGEFTLFLNTRGEALSNILKLKIKIVD